VKEQDRWGWELERIGRESRENREEPEERGRERASNDRSPPAAGPKGDVLLVDLRHARATWARRTLERAGYEVAATRKLSRVPSFVAQQPWTLVVVGDVSPSTPRAMLQTLHGRVPAVVLSDEVLSCCTCRELSLLRAVVMRSPFVPARLLGATQTALALAHTCGTRLTVGPITVALDTDEVWVDGSPRAAVKELLFRLLRYLLLRPGILVPLCDLEREVWKARVAYSTVASQLSRLRNALACPQVRIVLQAGTCAVHVDPSHASPGGRAPKNTRHGGSEGADSGIEHERDLPCATQRA
jgi:DNA-binding response OmpR family regulator